MTIRIGTNIASLGAQRRLNESTSSLERTYERLSSGMRINRASDDAAGLAIATSLRADARIYSQGIRNLNDGVSALSIAEGAVSSLTTMITRMRELASQSANGTYSSTQRQSLNSETQALISEFNRITSSTSFNGRQLLDGTAKQLILQAGGSQIQVGVGVGFARTVGTGNFISSLSYTSTAGTGGAQFGDINGDGINDMVLTNQVATNDIRYAIGNGDGTFQAEQSFTQGFSARVSLADVNNDGFLDIVGTGNGSGIFYVNLGNGDGSFRANMTTQVANSFPGGAGNNNLMNISFGDFNGDGILDAVVGNTHTTATNDRVYLLLGNGDGTFQRTQSFDVGDVGGSSFANVGDINNDGKLDFIFNTGSNNHIILGNGDGTFRSPVTLSMGAGGGNGAFLVDLNNDGKLDILSAVTAGGGNLSIQLGNGDGTFRAAALHRGGADNNPFTIGDINGDGIIDIVVHQAGGFSVNLGNGDGTFAGPMTTSITTGGTVRVTDINNDGVSEVVVIGIAGNQMGIYNPQTTTTGSIQNFNILTQQNARSVLSFLDTVQQRLGRENGWLGSFQSRIKTAGNNLATLRENYMAAESRITDVDVADESALLIKNQILQKIGAQILTQANLQPRIALSLLE